MPILLIPLPDWWETLGGKIWSITSFGLSMILITVAIIQKIVLMNIENWPLDFSPALLRYNWQK